MKKHHKVYKDYFDIAEDEWSPCEVCGATAVDIHHIEFGRYKRSDEIGNLIGLCRYCHAQAHNNQLAKQELQAIVAQRND